ncbi:hypothetical protein RJ641_021713 [Dillenia turbinata]|uniref:Uncharacterized protein n=1 Tax=Dillenia turbinata TaxID=194707 RepID=A0AAN8UPV7_9MAGN
MKNKFSRNEANGSLTAEKKVTVVFVWEVRYLFMWSNEQVDRGRKGTQCANIVQHYGFTHLSAGDLLHAEIKSAIKTLFADQCFYTYSFGLYSFADPNSVVELGKLGNSIVKNLVGLDCIVNVVRALRMGSCFLDDGAAPLDSATPESRKLKTPKKKPQRDEWLQMIPGRMSFSGSTSVASLFTKQGKKGINQDAMIVWENYCSRRHNFCGVFDGHGPYGHMVARRVRDAPSFET